MLADIHRYVVRYRYFWYDRYSDIELDGQTRFWARDAESAQTF